MRQVLLHRMDPTSALGVSADPVSKPRFENLPPMGGLRPIRSPLPSPRLELRQIDQKTFQATGWSGEARRVESAQTCDVASGVGHDCRLAVSVGFRRSFAAGVMRFL